MNQIHRDDNFKMLTTSELENMEHKFYRDNLKSDQSDDEETEAFSPKSGKDNDLNQGGHTHLIAELPFLYEIRA